MYSSERISKVLTIKQGNSLYSVPQETAFCHIEDTAGELKLYIPRDPKDKFICLSSILPNMLLKHLGAVHNGLGSGLGAIIQAPDLDVVDFLLEDAGIIPIPGVTRPQEDENIGGASEQACDATSEQEIEIVNIESASHLLRTDVRGENQECIGLAPYTPRRNPSQERDIDETSSSVTPGPDTPSSQSELADQYGILLDGTPSSPTELADQYGILLDDIMEVAQSLGTLSPEDGALRFNSLEDGLSTAQVSFALSSPIQGEREFKTGAAGELFVSH